MIIPVELGKESYDIVLKRGILDNIDKYIPADKKIMIVTDDGVPYEHVERALKKLERATVVTLPQGESTKCLEKYSHILSKMLENSFTRGDAVVAIGGGVVGDIAGFAAATYMRGIDFYNVPTTLLSQVDSSIGGKVAINFGGIKNVVGAFWQPRRVFIDPSVLCTLDKRQLFAGLAEAVKMAATCDEKLFSLIENSEDINAALDKIIEGALLIKRDVVEKDPKEAGLRRVLNFGHTVGHAVESIEKGALLHGECVALGMLFMCSDEVRERLRILLERFSLPTKTDQSPSEILELIKHDKKSTHSSVSVVFVEKIGSFELKSMTYEEISERLEKLI